MYSNDSLLQSSHNKMQKVTFFLISFDDFRIYSRNQYFE